MADYSLPRIKESALPEATNVDKVRVLDDAGKSVWVEKEDLPITEEQVTGLTDALALKADANIQIAAGNGLTGGGDLSENRTINVASADDGITVNADNIQLNTVNNLTTSSATRPLSAAQGKKLQDEKEALSNKSTDIAADTGSTDKYPSVAATEAHVAPVRYDNEAIDLDNLGDVRLRSIDVDNLPKISGFDMFVISTTAPSVAPDFIPQIWVDTTQKKAYIAVGVSTSEDFIPLN